MFISKLEEAKVGYTYDDVLLIPGPSRVEPVNVSVESSLTRNIKLNIPIISSPMDTVSEAEMAIALARLGGIGIIHRNNRREVQAEMIRKVKREESLIIRDLYTVSPGTTVQEAISIMNERKIAGLPVILNGKLVGILTNRDVRFLKGSSRKVEDVMTKDVVTGNVNLSMDQALSIMNQRKIEKLPLVDDSGNLVGLITAKDILKREHDPLAVRDEEGKLLVGGAVGAFDLERAKILEDAGADVIVVDSAHGHNLNLIDSVKKMRKEVDVDIIAGNIATSQAAEDLISAGVDGLRTGIGPGSICTTRIVAGIGVPQLTAIAEAAEVADKHGIPVIADGGIRYSGDIAKAIAAGASSVMLGSLLAGTDEAPGTEINISGRRYKTYRGMGSLGAVMGGENDRYGKIGMGKFVPEGVEGAVPYKGKVADTVFQLIGGLKSGMGYTGSPTIRQLRENGKFILVTQAGITESHPHNVMLLSEPPNYTNRTF
ncbi:MAG: IMP dehydrogenase [Candidatus Thermoplasmatota archaeon]|jgi:IMP dehydrogenase|nr:IMP dehydrogenase [Candidatus Thermoplasmatota archaeon]MCL5874143.1 IMP dehydrogenase [Candidatus Thermoplasmatota archaeon]